LAVSRSDTVRLQCSVLSLPEAERKLDATEKNEPKKSAELGPGDRDGTLRRRMVVGTAVSPHIASTTTTIFCLDAQDVSLDTNIVEESCSAGAGWCLAMQQALGQRQHVTRWA
jgi:hypothetical protein